jgi:elongation factor P
MFRFSVGRARGSRQDRGFGLGTSPAAALRQDNRRSTMATTYGTSDFKKGLRVEFDGDPYLVVDYEFRKPGKGQAVYTLRVKNLLTGKVLEKSFRSGDSIQGADCEDQKLQYLYNDSRDWHFMHPQTYEQFAISKEVLGDAWKYLTEEMSCDVTFFNGRPISVSPPNHVTLEVTYCEPGAKGNTATNVTKPATVQTGAEFQVPIFIKPGDVIKVDTRTGEYIERVQR